LCINKGDTQMKSELTAKAAAALAEARANPSAETRQAAIDASKKLSAWILANDPPKTRGYSCRAGKRQYAEMRAQQAERTLRAALKVNKK
jgi:hypothetical protein